MKEEYKNNREFIKMLNVVLALASAAMLTHNISHTAGHIRAIAIINLIAILIESYYCFFGYAKNQALFYRLFLYAQLLGEFLLIICNKPAKTDTMAFLTISFGAVCILATGIDLGKKKSFCLAGISFAAHLLVLIKEILVKSSSQIIFGSASQLIISVLMCLMIIAKYNDKASRNTK